MDLEMEFVHVVSGMASRIVGVSLVEDSITDSVVNGLAVSSPVVEQPLFGLRGGFHSEVGQLSSGPQPEISRLH